MPLNDTVAVVMANSIFEGPQLKGADTIASMEDKHVVLERNEPYIPTAPMHTLGPAPADITRDVRVSPEVSRVKLEKVNFGRAVDIVRAAREIEKIVERDIGELELQVKEVEAELRRLKSRREQAQSDFEKWENEALRKFVLLLDEKLKGKAEDTALNAAASIPEFNLPSSSAPKKRARTQKASSAPTSSKTSPVAAAAEVAPKVKQEKRDEVGKSIPPPVAKVSHVEDGNGNGKGNTTRIKDDESMGVGTVVGKCNPRASASDPPHADAADVDDINEGRRKKVKMEQKNVDLGAKVKEENVYDAMFQTQPQEDKIPNCELKATGPINIKEEVGREGQGGQSSAKLALEEQDVRSIPKPMDPGSSSSSSRIKAEPSAASSAEPNAAPSAEPAGQTVDTDAKSTRKTAKRGATKKRAGLFDDILGLSDND